MGKGLARKILIGALGSGALFAIFYSPEYKIDGSKVLDKLFRIKKN